MLRSIPTDPARLGDARVTRLHVSVYLPGTGRRQSLSLAPETGSFGRDSEAQEPVARTGGLSSRQPTKKGGNMADGPRPKFHRFEEDGRKGVGVQAERHTRRGRITETERVAVRVSVS